MKTITTFAALGLLWGAGAAALPPKAAERVDAVVRPYAQAGMFNGIVLVAEGEQVPVIRLYGMANYEHSVPIRRDTRFQVGSISKLFTQAALAVLLDDGRLKLDTPVSAHLPDFPGGREITVQTILDEKSGIPHTNDLPAYRHLTHLTLAESVELLKREKLDFAPGTKRKYSNGAYDVLALMIERASGTPFRQFVRERVIDRLGLADTGFVDTYAVVARMADPYTPGRDVGGRSRASFYAPEIRPGGGAMYSSADDVLTFLRAAFGGRLTTAENTANLFGDRASHYQPTGRNPGYSAVTFTDAARGVYVVTLANNGAALDNFGRRVYQAAIDDPWDSEAVAPVARTVPPGRAADFSGTFNYEGFPTEPFLMRVDGDGDLLVNHRDSDVSAAMIPLAGGRWLHPLIDAVCKPEGDGRVDAFICTSVIKRRQDRPFRIVRVSAQPE